MWAKRPNEWLLVVVVVAVAVVVDPSNSKYSVFSWDERTTVVVVSVAAVVQTDPVTTPTDLGDPVEVGVVEIPGTTRMHHCHSANVVVVVGGPPKHSIQNYYDAVLVVVAEGPLAAATTSI